MSTQKYSVELADTAREDGEPVKHLVVEVADDEFVEDVALEAALAEGDFDGAHYLVVGIERGEG